MAKRTENYLLVTRTGSSSSREQTTHATAESAHARAARRYWNNRGGVNVWFWGPAEDADGARPALYKGPFQDWFPA